MFGKGKLHVAIRLQAKPERRAGAKWRAGRRVVPALIARRSRAMSLMRGAGTRKAMTGRWRKASAG